MRAAGMGAADQKQKGRISKDESSRNGSCESEAEGIISKDESSRNGSCRSEAAEG
jgi:hypothetical protein